MQKIIEPLLHEPIASSKTDEEVTSYFNKAGALLAKKLQMALQGVTVSFNESTM